MNKRCNNQDLNNKGIDSKYYLLYQVWKELTERKTMDSYQYHIMNSLEILRELSTVIGHRLNRYHTTNHNIDEVKAEARTIIAADPIITKYYPCIKGQLISHLSGKTETDAQLRALRYQIEYTYNIINTDYLKYLLDELEADIVNANRDGIVDKANMVISNCASRGWSTLALNRLIDILNGSKTDSTKWNYLKHRLLVSAEEEYNVYIPLKVKLKVMGSQTRSVALERVYEEIRDMGIQLKLDTEITAENTLFDNSVLSNGMYMSVTVSACDYYAASYKAIDRCMDVLNVISFYNFIEAWNVKDIVCWAVNIENNTIRRIRENELYGTYDYIDSTQKIYRTAKTIYSVQGTSVQGKLHDVYAYTNMGKASGAQEERFMNTWIALESFCRSDVYDNIISNVLETVPPALCLRYIYQHFRNFVEDCLRCAIQFNFSTRTMDITAGRSKEEIVVEMIEIFNDTTLYAELLSKCNVNDLLVYRCEKLHELMDNKQSLFDKIERHCTTVRRQLSRLYRIRNDIAHNAMTTTGTLMLYIEHLDDYLMRFVAEVIMCAEQKQEENIEIIFEIIKDNYRAFSEIIHNKKVSNPTMLLEKLLKNGIIDLI